MKRQISFSSNMIDFRIVLLAVCIIMIMNLPAVSQNLTSDIAFGLPASGDIIPAPSELRDLIERYSADQRSLERYYNFSFSSARLSRFKDFNQEWLGILEGIDFNRLSQDGRIDYILLKNHLTRGDPRHWLAGVSLVRGTKACRIARTGVWRQLAGGFRAREEQVCRSRPTA
jgi:hypothetical protein